MFYIAGEVSTMLTEKGIDLSSLPLTSIDQP